MNTFQHLQMSLCLLLLGLALSTAGPEFFWVETKDSHLRSKNLASDYSADEAGRYFIEQLKSLII
jgi:hypothetical protein